MLIIDQFEELFTQCTDERERRAFVEALCAASGVIAARESFPVGQALIAIGIRADFYARCASYAELAPFLQDHQVLVGPIDEMGLREAIEGPASMADLVVDTGLVDVLLADLGLRARPAEPSVGLQNQVQNDDSMPGGTYEVGRLPLLAYALRQTCQHSEGRRLTVAAYKAIGGIDGAVARAAETVYGTLDDDSEAAARRIMLRLVALGEGTADTRRRATMTELTGVAAQAGLEGTAAGPQVRVTRDVVAAFVQARLLTADADASGIETVQISHEALLSAWPRLRSWLSTDRAGQRIHRELTEAAHSWASHGREPARLLAGARLVVARDWAEGHYQDLNAGERAYLAACLRRERRGAWLRRTIAATLSLLLIAVLVAGGLALRAARIAGQQRDLATQQRDLALSDQLAAQSEALDATDPVTAALLAAEAARFDFTQQARDALLDVSAQPFRAVLSTTPAPFPELAFSPDGKLFATASRDGISVWDTVRLRQIGRPIPAGRNVDGLAFSPDGHQIASADTQGTARVWDVSDHREIGTPLETGGGSSNALAFGSGGPVLAVISAAGQIQCWDVRTRQRTGVAIAAGAGVVSLTLSDSGALVGAASQQGGRVWDVATGTEPIAPVADGSLGADYVVFSRDGRLVATVNGAGAALSRIPAGQRPLPGLLVQGGMLEFAAFSRDGSMLATGGAGGLVQLWNTADWRQIGFIQAGTSQIAAMAFSPTGNTLAVVNEVGQIQLLDTADWRQIGTPITTGTQVTSLAFSATSGLAAIGETDGAAWLWNIARRRKAGFLAPFSRQNYLGGSAALSPDDRYLAIDQSDGTARIWNVSARRMAGTVRHLGSVWRLAFSPDGKILAALTADSAELVNVASGEPAGPALAMGANTSGAGAYEAAIAFSADGRTLIAATPYVVNRWDVSTHRELPGLRLTPATTALNELGPVALTSDGRTVAVTDAGAVSFWNTTTRRQIGAPLQLRTTGGYPFSLALSSDGNVLAAAYGSAVTLWDITTHQEIGTPLTFAAVPGDYPEKLEFSPDDSILGAVGLKSVWLWDIGLPEDPLAAACSIAGRTFTQREWDLYLRSVPYQKVCQ